MKKLLLGVFLLVFSFLYSLLPIKNPLGIVLYGCTFCYGLLNIYESLILLAKCKFGPAIGKRRILRHILLAGMIGGLLIEMFGNWLFKAWVYPHFSATEYLLIILPLLSFYFLLLFENYIAVVTVIEKFIKFKPRKYPNHRIYKLLFLGLGITGTFFSVLVFTLKVINYKAPDNYLAIFNTYWSSKNDLLAPIVFLYRYG